MKIRTGLISACLGLVLSMPASLSAANAVEFTQVDLEGKTQSLEDYRGRWVVVNFWATWCPPCLDEIPDLVSFHDAHAAHDAVVLGINYENVDREKLRQFVDDYLISYPVIPMGSGSSTPFGRILGLPTTFLIDPDGVPVASQAGPVSSEMIERFMQRYAQEH